MLTTTNADCGTAGKREWHIAAEFGGQVVQGFCAEVSPEQIIDRNQRRRRIGRAAAHSAGNGHVLVDAQNQLDCRRCAGCGLDLFGHFDHQVGLIGRHRQQLKVAERAGYLNAVFGGNLSGHSFAQVDREVEAGHIVIAALEQGPNLEKQIHFARCGCNRDLARHQPRVEHFKKLEPKDFVVETGGRSIGGRPVTRRVVSAGLVLDRDSVYSPS